MCVKENRGRYKRHALCENPPGHERCRLMENTENINVLNQFIPALLSILLLLPLAVQSNPSFDKRLDDFRRAVDIYWRDMKSPSFIIIHQIA